MAVRVHLWTSIARFADGNSVVEVEAKTKHQMLMALIKKHPPLKPVIDGGVSVSVNGELSNGGLHDPIPDGAEVYLLQQLRGG